MRDPFYSGVCPFTASCPRALRTLQRQSLQGKIDPARPGQFKHKLVQTRFPISIRDSCPRDHPLFDRLEEKDILSYCAHLLQIHSLSYITDHLRDRVLRRFDPKPNSQKAGRRKAVPRFPFGCPSRMLSRSGSWTATRGTIIFFLSFSLLQEGYLRAFHNGIHSHATVSPEFSKPWMVRNVIRAA
jgi:hypothetical protein